MKKKCLLSIFTLFLVTTLSLAQDNTDLDQSIKSNQSFFDAHIQPNNQNYNTDNITPPFLTSSTVVLPSNGSSSQNGRAPQGGRRYVRTAYLISPAEMTTAGFGANLVSALGWTYLSANPQYAQDIATTCDSIVIYMQNTANTTYSKGTTWTTIISGMTKVYVGKYNIPSGIGPHYVDVNLGGTGTSPFSTVSGQGVYIAFEYTNGTNPIANTVAAANVTCTNILLGGLNPCATGQASQTAHTAVLTTTAFRPETRFSVSQTYTDITSVGSLYTAGKGAMCICPDSNRLTYKVDHLRNVADNFNVKVSVKNIIGGTVKYEWNDIINSSTVQTISRTHAWTKDGDMKKLDSVVIEITPVAGENVLYNNKTNEKTAYVKQSTINKWNYVISTDSLDGGVGVTGASPGRIAASFNALCSLYVCQINLGFNRFDALDNKPYHIEIYNDDGSGLPGTLLHSSPGLRVPTSPSTGRVPVDYILTTPLKVLGRYHVAIIQDSLINFGLGFQWETPIRTGVFSFKNTTATVWTDAGSAAAAGSFVFRPDIGVSTSLTLNIKAYLEGFFDGSTMVPDTMTVIAHSFSSPYTAMDTAKALVGASGNGSFGFCRLNNDSCYFFEARHRNHINTWSHQVCEKIDECDKLFDYSIANSQSFGPNQKFISGSPGGWSMYGGEVNGDQFIDAGDLVDIYNTQGASGYVITDCNGDDFVDVGDIILAFNNSGCGCIGEVLP